MNINIISQYKGLRRENYILCFGRLVTAMGRDGPTDADDDTESEAWYECGAGRMGNSAYGDFIDSGEFGRR